MKAEQISILLFLASGIIAGIVSNYLNNFMFAFVASIVIYLLGLMVVIKFMRERKVKKIVTNTFITFLLFWLVVWILLYNL